MLLSLVAAALLGEAAAPTTPSEAEKWIGPVIASVMSGFASLFAWLTSRDRLHHETRVTVLEKDHAECKEEHAKAKADVVKLQKIVRRLGANVQALLAKKPLPFPNEFGLGAPEDDVPPEPKAEEPKP